MTFPGPAYAPELDSHRLARAMDRVRDFWLRTWGTLDECTAATGVPPASASSLFRQLGNEQNGGFVRLKRRRGDPAAGLWEYHLEMGAEPVRTSEPEHPFHKRQGFLFERGFL